jgi:small-conductance mechanosensitive channel
MHEFESSAIQLRIAFHAESVSTRMAVRSDIMLAVRREFAANNILIPYPQVVVHKANDEEETPPAN